jgi:hypothetical protein
LLFTDHARLILKLEALEALRQRSYLRGSVIIYKSRHQHLLVLKQMHATMVFSVDSEQRQLISKRASPQTFTSRISFSVFNSLRRYFMDIALQL